MTQFDLRLQELERQLACDERLRTHEHLRAIRETRRGPAPRALRQRLGGPIIRLGQLIAGESHGSPALTG